MAPTPRIAVVGPGRLGSALAMELRHAGYRLSEIVSRSGRRSRGRARALAQKVYSARTVTVGAALTADLVWICVPDREISRVARQLATSRGWKGKTVFHSSGALSSDELAVLRRRGAAVFSMSRDRKAIYHAWGGFTSPLLIALLVTAEGVAQAAGISTAGARKKMLPIVRQTLANYARLGPAKAFSGPIVRGDAKVVRQHLKELKKIPGAREVYLALAKAGLRYLPAHNRKELEKLLRA
jgi:predicted short-subunit dehydrogenase-like oxidoreductase (DUF2520 family)